MVALLAFLTNDVGDFAIRRGYDSSLVNCLVLKTAISLIYPQPIFLSSWRNLS